MLPILEEPLAGAKKTKVAFLDGLVQALDHVGDTGPSIWLIAPARRVMGLDWVPPYMVKAARDPKAGLVFMEGRLRNLFPYNWWEDISVVEKRTKIFHELVAAVSAHPALKGWVIMDRALEWPRPDPEVADVVLKSHVAEIRERNEESNICLGLNWTELLDPELAKALSGQVDGILISGLENLPPDLNGNAALAGELSAASYLGTMAQWVFGQPTEVEAGWAMMTKAGEPEEVAEAFRKSAQQGLAGVNWLSLVDPGPGLKSAPPWVLRPGLERVGLLSPSLRPRPQGHQKSKNTKSTTRIPNSPRLIIGYMWTPNIRKPSRPDF
jgi:hypothetical protein